LCPGFCHLKKQALIQKTQNAISVPYKNREGFIMLHREPKTAPEYIYPVDEWRIIEKRFAPRYLEQSETIFTLANGYMGIRGAFEEGRPAFQNGTFINGFHETNPIVYAKTAYGFAKTAQTMLNVADGKRLRLFVDDEPFILEHANLLHFERILDMRKGCLERRALWETPAGKRVEIRSTRLVSFEHRHRLYDHCPSRQSVPHHQVYQLSYVAQRTGFRADRPDRAYA
jgi:hypothetical protein